MSSQTEKKADGQVSLTQMLNALDKDVAVVLGKRLKKLSKKAVIKAPLDDHKARSIERKAAYTEVSKELDQWDPIVDERKKARQLNFPLDEPTSVLPSSTEAITGLQPIDDFERQINDLVKSSDDIIHDKKPYSKAEEKYLKAIDAEEAKARQLELQRMRVLLSCYAAKMRRQKAIKSKSYRRLIKHDKIKQHMKRVESSKDNFIEEVEKLKRLRAQERASLKHKNTGKWAKHAKFRTKYDEAARQAMIEQMGLSEKLRQKPVDDASSGGSSSETDDDDDESLVSACERSDGESSVDDDEIERRLNAVRKDDEEMIADEKDGKSSEMLIVNSDLISNRMRPRTLKSGMKKAASDESKEDSDSALSEDDINEQVDEDEIQHRLMSEAFAGDDVVSAFKKEKEDLLDEEQPKDINQFLPGWGDWAGPGIKVNKKKMKRYTIKAKRRPRRDDKLGNVIISEEASAKSVNPMQVKDLPKNLKEGNKFAKLMQKPIVSTFTSQIEHREAVKPRVQVKMGARVEPMNKQSALKSKVKFV